MTDPFPIHDAPAQPPQLTPRETQLAEALSLVTAELSDIRHRRDALPTPAHSNALRLLRHIGYRNWTAHLR